MEVLVAGGTGFIGTGLCRELHDRGHDVTALARGAETASVPAGVEAAEGDVTEPDTLTGPVDGVDAIYNLVALSPLFKPPQSTSHDAVHRRGTENLLAAAADAGVDRFVQQSALGADPNGPTAYLRAKGEAERAVRGSDLTWTVFRPSVVFCEGCEFLAFCRWVSFPPMTDRLFWPHVTPLPGAGARFQPIWREDLVHCQAAAIEDDDHIGATYELGGPEVFTLAELVEFVHEVEGSDARVLPVPTELGKLGLSLGEFIPGFPLGADQGRSLDIDNVPTRNDVTAFGREEHELRTLRSYLGLE